jgi:hypothetical protein
MYRSAAERKSQVTEGVDYAKSRSKKQLLKIGFMNLEQNNLISQDFMVS